MTPIELLHALQDACFTVQVRDGVLTVGPRRLLSPEWRALIKEHAEQLKGLAATGWPADIAEFFEAMQACNQKLKPPTL